MWEVNARCINCMASRTMAPDLLVEQDGRSVFARQPVTNEELIAAWRAVEVCPTAAVRAPHALKRPTNLFPQELTADVFRLGFNAQASYGAHSYFATTAGARVMVDAPRWSAHLAAWMSERGGLDHVLLTHSDDVADAERYAKQFGARVWIHEYDAASAPFATDIWRGDHPQEVIPGVKMAPAPGHTRGSVMYLVEDRYLFTGDSLAWNAKSRSLEAFRDVCWYDWSEQLRSLQRLLDETFSWILAGHGGSVELSPLEMKAQLTRFLAVAQLTSGR
jgi:glyoxylase-like metal-dependent hydrolase (beta-lactamase superfamily II)